MNSIPGALSLCALLLLSGCENDAVSHQIDGKDHSITLVREQRWFWKGEVEQRLVVARYPACQRRYEILPGSKTALRLELYEVAPRLFVAHQGSAWYAVSTEACQLQKFESPPEAYGELVGVFVKRDGVLKFVPAAPGGVVAP